MKIINDTTFELTKKEHLKFEVGDSKQSNYFQQLKVMGWENDCNFSIRLINNNTGKQTIVDNKIQYATDKWSSSIYEKDAEIEFDVTLNEKPSKNTINFSMEYKEVEFYYQPALTESEIAEGKHRPENVVGSYAVYHKSKKDNEFKTGKVCHIYRPWAIDANENKVWCDLNIDEDKKLLTITVPQEFIDTAVYPVLIDPTFGNIIAGASYVGVSANYAICIYVSPGATIFAKSIHAYHTDSGGGTFCKGVIFDFATGVTISNGVTPAVGVSSSPSWDTMTYSLPKPICYVSTQYYFGLIYNNNGLLYYDSGNPYSCERDMANNYAAPNNFNGTPVSEKYSIYVTYVVPPTVATSKKFKIHNSSLVTQEHTIYTSNSQMAYSLAVRYDGSNTGFVQLRNGAHTYATSFRAYDGSHTLYGMSQWDED